MEKKMEFRVWGSGFRVSGVEKKMEFRAWGFRV